MTGRGWASWLSRWVWGLVNNRAVQVHPVFHMRPRAVPAAGDPAGGAGAVSVLT